LKALGFFVGNRAANHYGLALQLSLGGTDPWNVNVADDQYYRLTVTGRARGGTTAQLFGSSSPYGTRDSATVSGATNAVETFTLTTTGTGIQMRTGTATSGGHIVIRLNETNQNLIVDSIQLVQVDAPGGAEVALLMNHSNAP